VDVRLGTTAVAAVHLGGEKVWPVGGPSVPVTRGIFAQFDASAVTGLTDGQAIAQWDDTSGNNRYAQAVSTGPTYRTRPTHTNIDPTMPVAQFTDNCQSTVYPYTEDPWTVAPGEYTLIAALATTSGAPTSTLMYGRMSAKISAAGFPSMTLVDVADLTPSTAALTPGRHTIVVYRFSDATNSYSYRVGGTPSGTFTSAATHGGGVTGCLLGSFSAGREFFNGEIAEVIEYAAHLTDAECAQVEDYLRTKWGIA
jgi:hypothetical protein